MVRRARVAGRARTWVVVLGEVGVIDEGGELAHAVARGHAAVARRLCGRHGLSGEVDTALTLDTGASLARVVLARAVGRRKTGTRRHTPERRNAFEACRALPVGRAGEGRQRIEPAEATR